MMRFFDDIELTAEEEDALTEAAEQTPLDDPELEAAVQQARARLAREKSAPGNAKSQTPPPPRLPASGR